MMEAFYFSQILSEFRVSSKIPTKTRITVTHALAENEKISTTDFDMQEIRCYRTRHQLWTGAED